MGDVLDEVAVDGNQALAALRPQRRRDAGRAPAPVETGQHGGRDFKGIHQGDHIRADRALLTRSPCSGVEKARGSVPAQIGHDHAVPLRGEHWRNFDVAMDVVRVAVQQQDHLPVARTGFIVTDVQSTGVDLSNWPHRDCGAR